MECETCTITTAKPYITAEQAGRTTNPNANGNPKTDVWISICVRICCLSCLFISDVRCRCCYCACFTFHILFVVLCCVLDMHVFGCVCVWRARVLLRLSIVFTQVPFGQRGIPWTSSRSCAFSVRPRKRVMPTTRMLRKSLSWPRGISRSWLQTLAVRRDCWARVRARIELGAQAICTWSRTTLIPTSHCCLIVFQTIVVYSCSSKICSSPCQNVARQLSFIIRSAFGWGGERVFF